MYDEKAKERTIRHLKKLKEVRFRVKPEDYAVYEKAAILGGYASMRQFYLEAIDDKIKKIMKGQ